MGCGASSTTSTYGPVRGISSDERGN
eukprot:COSAG01_NODE_22702_length_845_cov_0.808311_2_plen_25_part_01